MQKLSDSTFDSNAYKVNQLKQSILIFKRLIESQLCNNDLIRYTFFINLSIVIFLDKTVSRTVSFLRRYSMAKLENFDSVQCQPILDFRQFNFLTPRSVSQRGVTYFATKTFRCKSEKISYAFRLKRKNGSHKAQKRAVETFFRPTSLRSTTPKKGAMKRMHQDP